MFFFSPPPQSKIHAARSLSEIAIDLTETGTLKTSKLANMGSKGKIISGSSGSLLSSGQCTVSVCPLACVCLLFFSPHFFPGEAETAASAERGAGFCANVVTHATHTRPTLSSAVCIEHHYPPRTSDRLLHPQPPPPRPTLNLASEGRLSNISAGFLCKTFSFAAGMSVTCETRLAISRLAGWIN